MTTARARSAKSAAKAAISPNGKKAVAKETPSFIDLPGTKWVVGDGPDLGGLRQKYPGVRWAGIMSQPDPARHYRDAKVFVFPSLTDKVEVEEGLDVLLHRDATDIEEDRPRIVLGKRARAVGCEHRCIDTPRPQRQMREVARLEVRRSSSVSAPW